MCVTTGLPDLPFPAGPDHCWKYSPSALMKLDKWISSLEILAASSKRQHRGGVRGVDKGGYGWGQLRCNAGGVWMTCFCQKDKTMINFPLNSSHLSLSPRLWQIPKHHKRYYVSEPHMHYSMWEQHVMWKWMFPTPNYLLFFFLAQFVSFIGFILSKHITWSVW